MGYVESAPFFCADTETVKGILNNTMASMQTVYDYPLEQLM